MRITLIALALTLGLAFAQAADTSPIGPDVPAFQVRPGYRVTLAVDDLRNARFLEMDDKGTLFVSCPDRGEIVSLRDKDGDGKYEVRETFISGKKSAHGMQFKDGWLWFTQSRAIHKARDTDGDGKADETITVIPEGELPGGSGHWWRSILVTEDSIYTSVGDSGNITDEPDSGRQQLWRFDLEGKNKRVFATGIRNNEKLLLRPGTREIWGADHGSDWYGREFGDASGRQPITDHNPPDEFNLYVEGGFYGHPFIVGSVLPRLEYKDRADLIDLAAKTIPPEWPFGAHWATNGFIFLTKDYYPHDPIGDAFVACHGSWNSQKRVGYRVERILFDKVTGKPYGSVRIVGTLNEDGSNVLARPVDCVETADGSILFSCDQTGRVYRITYVGERDRDAL